MQFTIFLGALLSLFGFAMATTPPACIINAIGVQGSDASDMTVLCKANQDYVLGNMTTTCSSDNVQAAYDYYSSTCLEKAQITVSALPSESSGSSSSGSGSSSNNSTGNSVSSNGKENAATTVGATAAASTSLFMLAGFFLATSMTGVVL